jgi:hypothetical protein
MLCLALISAPQAGQVEGGVITEIPAGTRWATTLTNEPMSNPRMAPAAMRVPVIVESLSPGARPEIACSATRGQPERGPDAMEGRDFPPLHPQVK